MLSAVNVVQILTMEVEAETETIFGPITLTQNEKLGKHYIASRLIKPGEFVLKETSILSFPWSTDPIGIAICCGCYQKLDPISWTKCDNCQWPVCDTICGKIRAHANFECNYLRENQIPFDISTSKISYLWIRTLRALQVFQKYPEALKLESHMRIRDEILESAQDAKSVVDFIQNKCNLSQFEEPEIKHALGANEVNPFLCPGDEKYGCALFLACSMFDHDCEPNTTRVSTKTGENYLLEFTASKEIKSGEIVSGSYGSLNAGVIERRARLKREYYFDCECQRCLRELDELKLSEDKDKAN